jgi:predicted secreted protein
MASQKIYRIILIATLIITGVVAGSQSALAQTEQSAQASSKIKSEDAIGLEVQLHLLIATNSAASAGEEKLPSSLEAVVKQLRSTFVFKNYRLITTLLNRVSSGGRLSLRWVGSPLLAPSAATAATPGFNEFNVQQVRLVQDEQGRDVVKMENFKFGARIPIQVPSVASSGNTVPVVQYEQTGITTDISLREGEPTVVGTLNVGPSGDALIIVVSAKRPAPR